MDVERSGEPPSDLRTFVMPILWTFVLLFLIAQVFTPLSVGPVDCVLPVEHGGMDLQ